MDEKEIKEELEQETAAEEIKEEPAEETSEAAEENSVEETTEEPVAEEENPAEEPAEEVPVQKKAEKGGSNILGIIVGFAIFIAFLTFVWMSPVGNTVKDTGVFYSKDNDLYFYDMKNEPYLVQEGVENGGSYHYFYNAWGAGVAPEGDIAYYVANVDVSGAADLYRRNMKDPSAEAVLVDSVVYDYQISRDGDVAAYLTMKEDALRLCTFDGGSITTYAKGIHLEDDAYELSEDGRYLVFKDAYGMLCAAEVTTGGGEADVVVLTDNCPLYALSGDTLYFVSSAEGETYNIYSYDFKDEPVLVAENAQYMELMPNGEDLLYGVKPTEIIPYSELLEDDMAEIDANMKEDDPSYPQKLMRDELREAMASGEGLEPLLQEFYILSGGKATLVAENVVSAVAVAGNDRNFVTGYKAKEFQPLYLSVIGGGLEMVDMIYYMSLNYGGVMPFLTDGTGNVEVLTGSVLLDTLQVSSDGSKAAYQVEDETTGMKTLMQMEVGKAAEAAAVQVNVEKFGFLGGNGPLCYYYDYMNGAGTLAVAGSDRTVSNATGVEIAKDVKAVYYIADIDGATGLGQMQHWDGKDEPTVVDGGVFAFQYKGNGKAAVLYNYTLKTLTGDLGYYDGKGVTMLDTDITALYIN